MTGRASERIAIDTHAAVSRLLQLGLSASEASRRAGYSQAYLSKAFQTGHVSKAGKLALEKVLGDVFVSPLARRENGDNMFQRRTIFTAARDLRKIWVTSQSAEDPLFTEAWVELMRTAVAWRAAAKATVLSIGLPARQRPAFKDPPPKSLDERAIPAAAEYEHRLVWWASRFAWDRADGLPTDEAAVELMRVACRGSTEG